MLPPYLWQLHPSLPAALGQRQRARRCWALQVRLSLMVPSHQAGRGGVRSGSRWFVWGLLWAALFPHLKPQMRSNTGKQRRARVSRPKK